MTRLSLQASCAVLESPLPSSAQASGVMVLAVSLPQRDGAPAAFSQLRSVWSQMRVLRLPPGWAAWVTIRTAPSQKGLIVTRRSAKVFSFFS